ncbi:hypothetical protein D3OALGB2SA_3580 [Olavius algarvensis associated proteobacterium Delta 3]|nr:hypothetical protein D3OALGB2SA_3580 [Olavius algarvensis associated proteobacterium Delta 3]
MDRRNISAGLANRRFCFMQLSTDSPVDGPYPLFFPALEDNFAP